MEFFGVRLIGFTPESGRKLLLTLALLVVLWVVSKVLRAAVRSFFRGRTDVTAAFWSRQAVHILLTIIGLLILVSIWFDQPGRIGSMAGIITAGLAVALTKVVTSLAGYFVILRSRVFNIGDRIAMAGVRGDVIALSFLRTTILEMGQPPGEQANEPDVWVGSRQYTGRIVTVTNDKVFDEPIYNYSRDFPYIFEEMKIPIKYDADRARGEQILLEAARKHTSEMTKDAERAHEALQRKYAVAVTDLEPRVYLRLTDNWIELTVRFIAPTHGVRELKDKMAREIMQKFEESKIEIASATFEIVGLPDLKIKRV